MNVMQRPALLPGHRCGYARWLVAVISAATVGCAADAPGSQPTRSPELASIIEAAKDDVAHRTGLDQGGIRLGSAESVTWQDGSLGCPQPDMMYPQMIIPGFRVRMEAYGRSWVYHAAKSGAPRLCPTDQ